MSTDVRQPQGRHRAPSQARPTLGSAGFPALVGGVTAVLLGLVAVWQVL